MADATPAETAPEPPAETPAETPEAEPETDWQKEAEKWKSQSRKNEDRAKENARKAKELDEHLKSSMSDHDRAIAEAKDAGRSEALATHGARLVDAEVRVAAASRSVDVDALLEGLDRTRFLTDDGEPDVDAIKTWVERVTPAKTDEGPLTSADLGQGSRQSTPIGDDAAFVRMLTDITKS